MGTNDYNTMKECNTTSAQGEANRETARTDFKHIYRYLQKAGLVLAAISSTVLALPFNLHHAVITIATVLGSLGSLAVAISKILSIENSSSTDGTHTLTSQGIWRKNNVDKKAAA